MKQTHILSLQKQTLRQFRGMHFNTSEVMEVCYALSTKPPAGGGIGFETEALSILHYSSNSVLIRQALACLRVFQALLMKHGTISNLRKSDMAAWWKSVRHYTTTVGDLTKLLTATDPYAVEVVMNCCQLFISIDIMQQEFASSVRHFAYGLRIMISCRLRPRFDSTGEGQIIAPTHRGLPALDIFTLKLFTAPCPYEELFLQDLQKASEDGPSKVILFMAYRKSLTLIATETIDLLNRISSITSIPQAFMLSEEKERLLERLDEVEPRMKEEGFMGKNARTLVWKKMGLVYLLFSSSIRVVLRSSLRSTNGASLEQHFDDLISIATTLETISTSYYSSYLCDATAC
jgi:hypothetical protein